MRKHAIFFTFLLFCLTKAYSQQFYVASINGVQTVNINSGVATSQLIPSCTATALLGIAMHGNSFYYIIPLPNGSALYKANINNNVISGCALLANLGINGPNALTIDNSGILYYAAGSNLYKIDPNNPVPVKLGTMPVSSGGDLAFYNNDLYMASPNSIVKINLADPSQSTTYITVPQQPNTSLYGLTAVNVNNTIEFYAFSVSTSGPNPTTDVLELDMANQKVTGTLCTLPYVVYDAASLVEGGTTSSLQIDTAYISELCGANMAQVQIVVKPDVANATLTYTLNSLTNTTGLFSNLSPGNYVAHMASSSGAQKDTAIVVPDYTFNKATVNVSKTNPVCNIAGKIQFGMANSSLYTIQYNNAIFPFNHSFTGLSAGDYSFTIVNQGGCPVDTADVLLTQDICYPAVTFPNTFTPNNDSINDVFEPNQDGNATNYNLSIYDRWGALIFVSTDYHTGWNGQYKGKPVAVGTYYWIASYTDEVGKKNIQKGPVTLLR